MKEWFAGSSMVNISEEFLILSWKLWERILKRSNETCKATQHYISRQWDEFQGILRPVKCSSDTSFKYSPILLHGRWEFGVVVKEEEEGPTGLLSGGMTSISFPKATTRDLVSSSVMFCRFKLERTGYLQKYVSYRWQHLLQRDLSFLLLAWRHLFPLTFSQLMFFFSQGNVCCLTVFF